MAIVCNCAEGGKCQIHPKHAVISSASTGSAPEAVQNLVIDSTDKLTLKTLEAESLKAQIEMERGRQQLMQRAMATHQQLEQFSAAMFEKYGYKPTDYTLDLAKLEFVKREPK